GLRLTANDPGVFPGDQIAVHYQDANFTGQWTLEVDVWANWASNNGAGIGTTEHAGVYVGFDPNDVNAFLAPAQNGAGVLYDTDGDCTNCDYILVKDAAELDTFSGQYTVDDFGFGNQNGFDNRDGNDDFDIPTLFPEFDIGSATNNQNGSGLQPGGAGGFRWMTVTIEVDTDAIGNGSNGTPGTAKVSLSNNGNTLELGTVDNSVDDDPNDDIDTGEAPVGMSGGIALMMVDFFGGNPDPIELGFVLFDNVRVYDGFLVDGITGDFDGDSDYDCDDVDSLVAEIAAGTNTDSFDLTGDGNVDGDDLAAWLAEAGAANLASGNSYIAGDANLDGVVDVSDFNAWNANKFTTNAAWCSGDFNADGVVDVPDFNTWNANKFTSATDAAAVPEPQAVALAVVALVGLLRFRQRS
ncbi:MAG: hypothetical protein AAF497_10225, partial [Planctomycetota bacterium]